MSFRRFLLVRLNEVPISARCHLQQLGSYCVHVYEFTDVFMIVKLLLTLAYGRVQGIEVSPKMYRRSLVRLPRTTEIPFQGKKEKSTRYVSQNKFITECTSGLLGHHQYHCTPEDGLISRKYTLWNVPSIFYLFPRIEDVSPRTFTIIFKSQSVSETSE
jgi:hypothetical protein